MKTILVVEDEESLRTPLAFSLRRDGYEVLEAESGEVALATLEAATPDLILLDLMLPGISGTEVCRQVRRTSKVPIIMVTAKDDVVDRVVGLELGADDYVTKPYSYRELLARIRAVLRRRVPEIESGDEEDVLTVGDVLVRVDRHEVEVDSEPVHLPLREFELLELLMRNVNRVLTRTQIINIVWGPDYVGDTKTLDVHVKRLRSRIEADPSNPQLLQTVRGLGYKMVDPLE
ncbi:MAG: response regulator transcription factor [Actinomyces sp.]|uniref:response regulator transcription factor n=1 Tax=Actinomyces sp. TaxID=29317 RepID=UPI001ED3E53D|nr:response regulator transcription factor [Actinomyces sp.]MBS5826571.1 response regulator transcription factor [Actinomyces sp.]